MRLCDKWVKCCLMENIKQIMQWSQSPYHEERNLEVAAIGDCPKIDVLIMPISFQMGNLR